MAAKKAVNGLGIYFLVRDGEAKTDRTIHHKKVAQQYHLLFDRAKG
ncbi:MAG: hypothetical protein JGK17_18565 [Microcoleus sp. PH2017_10_PVI_O_A]|nr:MULTISPECIES: hypothetical protein [unclassified Microcoleus]MCC3407557.1 hypothetical protein [Microcoleus sp. PH2017_10_PVI_O_A]MCC3461732.1 hypothetical protein [Microcoleus sp. PH2017_11_PCY_U_A]MCC3481503.1 hypothetical protein [Microcoleus sp. PH2017_12_PCY_D_A]MCC3529193.1 hypothetical protein [Microcoleus sp. PH2017_21_RUC_O_A]MCC3543130.1 hypothetical protein [Microcoleus sp. PH2017_22_RUC_O_B]